MLTEREQAKRERDPPPCTHSLSLQTKHCLCSLSLAHINQNRLARYDSKRLEHLFFKSTHKQFF